MRGTGTLDCTPPSSGWWPGWRGSSMAWRRRPPSCWWPRMTAGWRPCPPSRSGRSSWRGWQGRRGPGGWPCGVRTRTRGRQMRRSRGRKVYGRVELLQCNVLWSCLSASYGRRRYHRGPPWCRTQRGAERRWGWSDWTSSSTGRGRARSRSSGATPSPAGPPLSCLPLLTPETKLSLSSEFDTSVNFVMSKISGKYL